MSAEWVIHKGKKILLISYRDLSPEQKLAQIREATQIIQASGSSENLTLTDVTDCFVDKEFIELAKQEGKKSLALTKKAAIVGVTGIKKILLDAVNKFSSKPRKPFSTIAQAKDWLVE